MYADLPAVFAKEIARRQQSGLFAGAAGGVGSVGNAVNSNSNHASTTPTSPPGSVQLNHLKRERSDDSGVGPGTRPVSGGSSDAHEMGGMMSNKRRDTGEG